MEEKKKSVESQASSKGRKMIQAEPERQSSMTSRRASEQRGDSRITNLEANGEWLDGTSLTFVVNNSESLPDRRLELFGRDKRYVAVAVLQQSDKIVLGQFARVIILNHQSIIAHYGFVSSTSARTLGFLGKTSRNF
jgi:hypothetical protein